MTILLLGHRGTGKSNLLKNISKWGITNYCFDLDMYIELKESKSISQIFSEKGEAYFRECEKKYLEELIQKNNETKIIALGGGFIHDLSQYKDLIKIFLNRPSDKSSRIFFDRPRLNSQLSASEEFKERYNIRNPIFKRLCDLEIEIEEGFQDSSYLKEIIQFLVSSSNLCLDKSVLCLEEKYCSDNLLNILLKIKDIKFELRSDLLSIEQIEKVLKFLPSNRLLLSFRCHDPAKLNLFQSYISNNNCDWDWASELGACNIRFPNGILSIHPKYWNAQEVREHIQKARELRCIAKIAPVIQNYSELTELDQFANQALVFPISDNGKWKFYRMIKFKDQNLNFIKMGSSDISDQPTILEALRVKELMADHWAAILGSPVDHSLSPAYHDEFFKKQFKSIMLRVDILESEWQNAISFLISKGMKWAAVTSPLKTKLFQSANFRSTNSENLKAANTLKIEDNLIKVHNTDLDGFSCLSKYIAKDEQIAVWGGGGTLEVMKSHLKNACYYSARSTQCKNAERQEHIDVLVWAIHNSHLERGAKYPFEQWRPKKVIDLNYSESSLAREYAIKNNAEYISGIEMFEVQARMQQNFWSQKNEK